MGKAAVENGLRFRLKSSSAWFLRASWPLRFYIHRPRSGTQLDLDPRMGGLRVFTV